MKLTSFETFTELAQRSTFVPVVKEIVADLLTPVSAFLKVAEHSDYAFLLESVEGGEHVARYSFLGKDPFVLLRSRDGRTIVERAGTTTESPEPFIAVLRKMMADFRSPFVPSVRAEADTSSDPFTCYRAVRHGSPSAYMSFLPLGKLSIVGSSPEMLVRVEGGMAQTHTIAGTRPRGKAEEEDVRLGEE